MNIKKRLLPAALIVIVTIAAILLCRATRVAYFMILAAVSVFELAHVLKEAELSVSRVVLLAYIIVHSLLCYLKVSVTWLIVWYALCAFAAMFRGVLKGEKGENYAVGTVFSLLWPFGFFALVIHASASEAWLPVLAIAILGAWVCDSMALIGGKLLGKHKLAPEVSPNKTWEGAVSGALFSILAGWLISLLLRNYYPVPALPCMVVTFASSCFGQVGDLAASLIKRMAGVKDYGHLMPEHGGIMDKMDSMIFAIPAAYLGLFLFGLI